MLMFNQIKKKQNIIFKNQFKKLVLVLEKDKNNNNNSNNKFQPDAI